MGEVLPLLCVTWFMASPMVHFGNYTGVPIAPTAEGIGDEPIDIATMHVVFMVSVYTLEHSTRLRRGQKVSVQSTSRGQAAIELASYSTGTSRCGCVWPFDRHRSP